MGLKSWAGETPTPESEPRSRVVAYILGEGANSLVMNGVLAFALMYYTKALGMDPFWAGVAMSVSMFWEAVSEPLMGHISDNTRNRWGRRHPYMAAGGALMAICGYLICAAPEGLRRSDGWLFGYLVAVNLVLRTGLTMFFIPYVALGFELCTDYQGRSRLQALRTIFNMAVNFAGPAMAWTFFLADHGGVRGTTMAANYERMGAVFAIVTAGFVLAVVAGTFKLAEDTRGLTGKRGAGWARHFGRDVKQIFLDPNARWVLVFVLAASSGTMWVGSLQMFVYDDFMKFPAYQKTLAHGGSMLGMAMGAYLSMGLAKRLDKRGAVVVGGVLSAACNGVLALVFVGGVVPPGTTWQVWEWSIPADFWVFVLFHAGYWLAIGIMMPVCTAMMADVAEISWRASGIRKDGGYSAVHSLTMRLAWGLGLLASGYGLHLIGYAVPGETGVSHQSPHVIWRLGMATFAGGAAASLLALLAIRKYPVTRRHLEIVRTTKVGTQD